MAATALSCSSSDCVGLRQCANSHSAEGLFAQAWSVAAKVCFEDFRATVSSSRCLCQSVLGFGCFDSCSQLINNTARFPFLMDDEQSCALDNFASTCADLSKLSDTLPSISIDDNNGDQDFFLKEHYDKIDRLRKENFDLKLKLYLLESNEKFTSESGILPLISSNIGFNYRIFIFQN